MRKLFLVAQALISYALLASSAFANPTVIVHINGQELHRAKNLLEQESRYFRERFAVTFSTKAPTESGEIHENLDRNFKSLQAVWDFLNYGEIYSSKPEFLKQVLADAEFLGIENLKKYLGDKLAQANTGDKWVRDFQVIRDISSSGDKKLSDIITTYADKEEYRLVSVSQVLNTGFVVFDKVRR